ncbi:MAK10-like protein [Tanacetum coccineum]
MGDANPIRTLGDYSKPSHEGYRNTIELPVESNVVPLQFDTIRLVQNRCSFHGLRSKDPNQHLKDFLKLVDSLNLNGEKIHHHMGGSYYSFPCSILSIEKDLKTPQRYPDVPTTSRRISIRSMDSRTIDQSASDKLHDRNAKESWALLENLALYDNESWNDPRDFAKPVKAISLPQDVPSTSDRRLIELKNQVQCLMEDHLALTQPTQVNKITTSCEICSGPYYTQYCMEDPEQAFVEYASSRTDKAGEGLVYNFMASQDARLSKFEADFKQQQSEMTNKINTVLKAITDRLARTLPSDTVKNPKLNVNTTTLVLFARSYPTIDPQCSSHPSTSINAIKTCSKEENISKTSQLQPRMGIRMQQPEEPEPTLEDEFQDLHLNLPVLEVLAHAPIYNAILDKYTDHIFGLADGTKSYPVGIVKDVEVHIGKLKLLNDFYVIDMKKDPETPLLIGRGFLATSNAVIDCRMAKIVVGEGITSSDGIGAQIPYYARKDFLDCHLPGEWEIARDAEINPFKDVLVFRRMVKFLGAIPINLKSNMWESEDLINNPINWNKPPKNGDRAWHAKIRLIDPDRKEFTKTLQSIPTTRKLSERESPREIIDLDHFYDT